MTRLVIFPASSPRTHCRWGAPCTPAGWHSILNSPWWNISLLPKRVPLPSLSPATLPHPFPYSQHWYNPVSNQFRPNSSSVCVLPAVCFAAWTSTSRSRTQSRAGAKAPCKAVLLLAWRGEGSGAGSFWQQPSVRWCLIAIQQGLSESHIRTAASKALLQTQWGARLKCLSDRRSVNSHMAAVATGHKTLSPVPDFNSSMFAFSENSTDFLKEIFCHLCYRIW